MCKNHELLMVSKLSDIYLSKLEEAGIKFLNKEYFQDYSNFERHQKIPEKYFTRDYLHYNFLSHRWLTPNNPDPNQEEFLLAKKYFSNLKPELQDKWGFWYDYSCIPQKNGTKNLTKKEKATFEKALNVMHLLPMLSSTIFLYDSSYLNRSWCVMEWICATQLSPVQLGSPNPIPFMNAIKFRHMAILILFLGSNKEFKTSFISGDDEQAITHLNALILNMIASCESTIENDKNLIVALLFEHFYYHLRAFGLRNQLTTAFLILENFDRDTIELFFNHFLHITKDVGLSWTKECLFIAESLFGTETPTDMYFHRLKLIITSNSKSEDI